MIHAYLLQNPFYMHIQHNICINQFIYACIHINHFYGYILNGCCKKHIFISNQQELQSQPFPPLRVYSCFAVEAQPVLLVLKVQTSCFASPVNDIDIRQNRCICAFPLNAMHYIKPSPSSSTNLQDQQCIWSFQRESVTALGGH